MREQALLLAALTLIACGSTSAPTAAGEPTPTPRCPEPQPTARAVPCPAPKPPAELRRGRYWVRLQVPTQAKFRRPSEPPDDPQAGVAYELEAATSCRPLDLDVTRRGLRLQVPDYELRARHSDGGWALRDVWFWGERGTLLAGECKTTLEVEGSEEGHLMTNAGPVFRTPAACETAPGRFVKRCVGRDCEVVDARSAPFELGDCQPLVRELGKRAGMLETSHELESKTRTVLDQRIRQGGRLWLRHPNLDSPCREAQIKRETKDRTLVRISRRSKPGRTVVATYVYSLRPLHRRAHLHGIVTGDSVRKARIPDGGTVGFYVGNEVIALGRQWLFTGRDACERTQLGHEIRAARPY